MLGRRTLAPTAIVLGATGAIGGAVCRTLARDGFDVIATYRSSRAGADAVVAAVREFGVAAEVRHLDLANSGSIREALSSIARLDAFIYAAGPPVPMRFLADIDLPLFVEQMHQDVTGYFAAIQAVLPALREAKGAVVSLVTIAVNNTISRDILSAAPKAAVEQITRAVAVEYGRFGVRANCVAPGLVEAGIIEKALAAGDYTQSIIDATRQATPLRRLGRPQDVAEAVAFLASERSSWISGQTLVVDGGYSR